MRYIYQEPVLTTVTDEDIIDDQSINDILLRVKNMQHGVHMSYEDPETQFIRALDNVRITNISDKTIDIHAFMNSVSVRYRDIPISNIRKIRIIASKQELSQRYKVNRFQMMEVAEVAEV